MKGLSEAAARSAENEHVARKRFGQHFLHDATVIHKIIEAIRPDSQGTIVEIGPGLGAITRPLLQRLNGQATLHVVELDRDLARRLRETYSEKLVAVHESDALEFDFGAIGGPKRLVGNLPYNVSTPLMFAFLRYIDEVIDQHFMLQKEVVDRMVAEPGSKTYGRLSVMLQAHYHLSSLFKIGPGAFNPPPKVDSAIVRMIPLAANQRWVTAALRPYFEQVVTVAFGQRRKMLRGSLSGLLRDLDFEKAQVRPTDRAENLDVAAFARLADCVRERSLNAQPL